MAGELPGHWVTCQFIIASSSFATRLRQIKPADCGFVRRLVRLQGRHENLDGRPARLRPQ